MRGPLGREPCRPRRVVVDDDDRPGLPSADEPVGVRRRRGHRVTVPVPAGALRAGRNGASGRAARRRGRRRRGDATPWGRARAGWRRRRAAWRARVGSPAAGARRAAGGVGRPSTSPRWAGRPPRTRRGARSSARASPISTGRDVAHHGALDAPGSGPRLGEHGAREREVPRLFLPVVPVERGEHRVGVGVLGGEPLQEVGDLLAGERHHEQQRVVARDASRDAVQQPGERGTVERVARRRSELVDEPDERTRVLRLLADLVEHVGDAGVGEVGRLGDHAGEARPRARPRTARPSRASTRPPRVRGGRAARAWSSTSRPAMREELVGDHLAGAERAPRQVGVGLDRSAARHRVEAVDAPVGAGARGRGVAVLMCVTVPHGIYESNIFH